MTSDEAKRLLDRIIKDSLKVVANDIIRTVDPFVPVATGALRRSAEVNDDAEGVSIDYNAPYAEKQYNEMGKPLHHLGRRGAYQSIGTTGSTYSKRYQVLKRTGKLVPSRAKWFDETINDSQEHNRLAKLMANYISSRL